MKLCIKILLLLFVFQMAEAKTIWNSKKKILKEKDEIIALYNLALSMKTNNIEKVWDYVYEKKSKSINVSIKEELLFGYNINGNYLVGSESGISENKINELKKKMKRLKIKKVEIFSYHLNNEFIVNYMCVSIWFESLTPVSAEIFYIPEKRDTLYKYSFCSPYISSMQYVEVFDKDFVLGSETWGD